MRGLMIFFISIIVTLLLISAFAFLLPSQVTVAKSVVIKAPKEKIREEIIHFRNWKNWYPPMKDNSVSMQVKNEDKLLLKDSSGREIIMKMIRSIGDTINVSFESISSSKIDYQFLLMSHNADSTLVTLNVNTLFKWYPWQKLKGIFLDKITGPMYEETLANLKRTTSSQPISTSGEGAKSSTPRRNWLIVNHM